MEDEILDAARSCVEAFGIRRTKLADVARRAGVSRPTVYRYWPDIDSLVGDLLTRELRALIEGARPAEGGGNARALIIGQCAATVRGLVEHSLFSRIIDSEPELLATYTFHRLGASQHEALALIGRQIEAGHADGSVGPGDVAAQARIVLLVVQSVATSRRLTADVLDIDGLAEQLRLLLDGYLRPEGTTA
ncbi:putative transcriptional regulator, TetR family protein [Wenjunlia tyrosinilytica]|uniref:Transcriptional regulator, TetR family protein n=1 Tax=Wenjunlia tyrosinilytica TaxID=1544741 RepID=A0A917ZRK4_9ACTN|nr:putative transcriptional regulator, TetR family protein [Wenjunlia tyrosinilytica]